MSKINRGTGSTESEKYLAKLADATFLNLWSYPNPFNDKGASANKDGKELCDLLVVCGNDVIIFSDKSIRWPENENVDLAWARWFKRAVDHSAKQLRGAERWIRQYPGRIFVDPRCETPLPTTLPAPDKMRVHLIAVALGAQKACSTYYGDRDGSLMVASDIVGDAHTGTASPHYRPFCFGDVAPNGTFIHVFDETALNLTLHEMNTIADLVAYLSDRANAIRNQDVFMAASEAEMLAYYLLHQKEDGSHLFPAPVTPEGDPLIVSLTPGSYYEYKKSPSAQSKYQADKISYLWDKLITKFSDHILAGTSISLRGDNPAPTDGEQALRMMALENRTARRVLAEALAGTLRKAEESRQDRFARVILPQSGAADPEAAYVFLILAYRSDLFGGISYDQYRQFRTVLLETYGDAILYDNRHLKRVVGVAFDASPRITGRKGGSEDLMLLERLSWNPEAEREIEERREKLDVMLSSRLQYFTSATHEFPIPFENAARKKAAVDQTGGNRRQRRAAKSQKLRTRR